MRRTRRRGFLPSIGALDLLRSGQTPSRIETGVEEGDAVSPFYDPMIAKLVSSARRDARGGPARWPRHATRRSSGRSRPMPGFSPRLLDAAGFARATVDTGFIAEHAATYRRRPSSADFTGGGGLARAFDDDFVPRVRRTEFDRRADCLAFGSMLPERHMRLRLDGQRDESTIDPTRRGLLAKPMPASSRRSPRFSRTARRSRSRLRARHGAAAGAAADGAILSPDARPHHRGGGRRGGAGDQGAEARHAGGDEDGAQPDRAVRRHGRGAQRGGGRAGERGDAAGADGGGGRQTFPPSCQRKVPSLGMAGHVRT